MSDQLYQLDTQAVLLQLNSDAQTGLSDQEAEKRLQEFGPNATQETGARHPIWMFLDQFKATMVLILISAAVVAALLGSYKDTIAIGVIVLLFALVGFIQEYRAEQAIAALKKLAVPIVRVIRGGQVREISSTQLVPGDIVLLEAGNLVPADARVVESVNLRIQEAALTGESEPIEKTANALTTPELALGDRRNMLYMGTVVTYGRGKAVVTGTGMNTELGNIAKLISDVRGEQTPLQKKLDQLGRMLAIVGIAVAALIVVLGLLRGDSLSHLLLTAVSVAVAVVPEGLPAVVTITLALGAQRMLERQALIRKLPAVETLGSVTVICSDKTGTLTENRMTVIALDVAGHRVELDQELVRNAPSLVSYTQGLSADQGIREGQALTLLLAAGALCNDAVLSAEGEEQKKYRALGDPTEGALVVAAAQFGLWKSDLEQALPRVAELPFDSDRKQMTTLHETRLYAQQAADIVARVFENKPFVEFTKGNIDGLLVESNRVWMNGRVEIMDEATRARILKANQDLAMRGMRVLGAAYRPSDTATLEESDFIFVGLLGLIDPPRSEVRDAVATCKTAGIRPVMITGDHPLTAIQIAKQLGIADEAARAVSGPELEKMSVDDLAQLVDHVSVYARVSPEHKLKIVQALENRGNIVAMTGDGVNDAPALRRADVGVAMGVTGTDVAKEASAIVLLNDNFATIVAAVEEGRVIYDNLRKFIKFSIAGNIGKVGVMLLAPFIGTAVPLLPLQLLWLNVLTDGLLGLGLGVEQAERGVMTRPPYSPQAPVLDRPAIFHVTWVGVLIAVLALGVGFYYDIYLNVPQWQSMIFTTLAFAQIFQALAVRSSDTSVFKLNPLSNPLLLLMCGIVLVSQLLVLYVPFLQSVLSTVPLTATDLFVCLVLGVVVLLAIELEKWWRKRQRRAQVIATPTKLVP
ncbi:MAG: cation-translocating P-type ATPase [Chloroflexota bacterium]|nr:MAG: cation-translocating P-type ATPase [Chloroflexota bacterium]